MLSLNRHYSLLVVLVLVGMMTLSGCATRKWVRQELGATTTKLEGSINATNTKVTEMGERIDAVDRRAQQGIQAADQKATQAGQAAAAADQKAVNAQRTADTANQAAQQVNTRVTSVENRFNSIDTYTAGPTATVTFKNNSSVLSDDAKKTLDDVASQIGNATNGYMIEIQGFTDDRGSENFNYGLSQRRAESVKRYLVGKNNIQLHRVSIVGLGEGNPVAENKTSKGREQNRRVEVKVLRSAQGRATTQN
jgi:outer membrane protein OmpA-like peptidoglycan-associated protein